MDKDERRLNSDKISEPPKTASFLNKKKRPNFKTSWLQPKKKSNNKKNLK